nr:MAG TPA: protein of unknown function (DUF4113) [Caudoviricetes sp.]
MLLSMIEAINQRKGRMNSIGIISKQEEKFSF